jgi:hypothetical protein
METIQGHPSAGVDSAAAANAVDQDLAGWSIELILFDLAVF